MVDVGQQDASSFIASNGLTMPFMKDVNSADSFSIRAIPRTIFFDRTGKIVSDKTGAMSLTEFEAELSKIL